jgi:hypothetical protein
VRNMVCIISGTGAATWSKAKFGPTGYWLLSRSKYSSSMHIHQFAIFLNASWKSCSVKVFSTTFSSASIVSKWRPFSFIFKQAYREKLQGAKSVE